MKKLRIPYMGGKQKYAEQLINKMLEIKPNAKYFYDLFGGGGSMSFAALQMGFERVIYNEIDPALPALIRDIRDNGVRKEYYDWVDRETFHATKEGTDWKAGLVKTCWSFGNNYTRGYLFSEHNEYMIQILHKVVVDCDYVARDKFSDEFGLHIPDELIDDTQSINARRLSIMNFVRSNNGRNDLQRLRQIQHLERLRQLENLQQLERLQQLEISNKSYDDVIIDTPLEETIVYCDPPYQNTKKYQNDIDHDMFEEWCRLNKYQIFVSSYDFYDYEPVCEIETRSPISSTNRNKRTVEKLFLI